MLLTLTLTGQYADDLGWLLHKRPDRFQKFDLPYGSAYVFFTETKPRLCTACLLLEVDGSSLNSLCKAKDGEFQYVNPRQFLSSSLLAGAIAKVFSSALKGSCADKPELAERRHDFEVEITNFSCRLQPEWIEWIFAPLGYAVEFAAVDDKSVTRSGMVGNLILRGNAVLKALLSQLYILLPVFDRQLHFWISDTQLQKFLRHGEGWLAKHPERYMIIKEYFWPAPELKYSAMEHFDALDETGRQAPRLNDLRKEAIAAVLDANDVQTVIDLGCGDGSLIAFLVARQRYARIAGMDVCVKNIETARKKLTFAHARFPQENIFPGSLTYSDSRMAGYDAAILSEVIEHFEPGRMPLVIKNILGEAKPRVLVLTTPNKDYNSQYALLDESMRHPDHRHEFCETEFKEFCQKCAADYCYEYEISEIGASMPDVGAPTLMGVFKKCE